MTQTLWSQDYFGKGELSPLMYSRITVNAYNQGLKKAQNIIAYPQGAAGKRFGTRFWNILSGLTDYTQVYFKSFQYLNECCYLVVISDDTINIFLERELIATVSGTGIQASEIQLIDYTILENIFRVTTGIHQPKDLTRGPNTPNLISGFSSTTLTITTPVAADSFWPARFTTTGAFPTTVPQIHKSKTYFVRSISTTTISIYSSAQDAAGKLNAYTISSAGTGTNNVVIQNRWSFANVVFKNRPVFDFDGGYSTNTFTLGAMTGSNITITTGGGGYAVTGQFLGGAFIAGSGIARIISITDPTHFVVNITRDFNQLAYPGSLVLIAEPAWSDTRGWPTKCSSFQNRGFFANSDSLTNGLWASVINDFYDYNDLDSTDDTNAISWYPSSDHVNYIQFIVPYRSLTIHTNSGVYSTPLSVETAITPKNFSMSLQDTSAADAVQPEGIDNQIIALSGNDAHSLLWDGFNNAYTSNIVSIANEQLIRAPLDQAAYVDRTRAGSRYMIIVNQDGSLAIYQTLIAENVTGFTPAIMEQTYGLAFFRAVTTNFDGRGWFLVERQIATASAPIALTANTASTLTAVASNFSTTAATAVLFTTTGVLPVTAPQITTTDFFWVIGVTADTFQVYATQADALAAVNSFLITDHGTNSNVVPYPLVTNLIIEELDFDAKMDCVGFYPVYPGDPPVSTITGRTRFNAQDIYMQGDGYGFTDSVVSGNVTFVAHGVTTTVSEAQYGFPINVEIQPLPLAIPTSGHPKSQNLVNSKHLNWATFLFADTVGGTIQNGNQITPIQLKTLEQTPPGSPPVPTTGKFEMSIFGAWNDFTYNTFTIRHSEPFDFKLTGIFYKVDM